MKIDPPPALDSQAYRNHAHRLVSSYHYWTREHLVSPHTAPAHLAHVLFQAKFAVVSQGTGDDPVFNFGNAVALRLFEMTWNDFMQSPSRGSVPPGAYEERVALMARVSRDGFVRGYRGVRVSAGGKRFVIADATVWEVVDTHGCNHGRAARFDRWWFTTHPSPDVEYEPPV